MRDHDFMKRALQLAESGRGYTSPNPMVGAVIAKKGKIIGEGFHPAYGKKHAEVLAIENATESVEGAELYCTLEPCCHSTPEKKTAPCTDRLIFEKINKVYIANLDPNPYVSGKGIKILNQAGIKTETGLLSKQAIYLNEAYFKFIQTHSPFVHLKLATSLDGRIATCNGDSKWITDQAALKKVHQLRHQYDAVLVGFNTVKFDNPRLTVRLIKGKQPYRIILDKYLNIPLDSHLIRDEFSEKTIIFTTSKYNPQNKAIIERRGVKINIIEKDQKGQIALKILLKELGKIKISSLLVEGGSQIFTDFIRQKLFDKISIFIAPLIIGKGIEAIGDLKTIKLAQALRLEKVHFEKINDQLLIEGYRNLKDTLGCLGELAVEPMDDF